MYTGLRIITTYRCNRRCSFCYQNQKDSVILSSNNLENALENVSFIPVYITMMGGEVSIFPNESESLFKIIQAKFPYSSKSIITNGDGDIEWYRSLYKFGISNITFSMPILDYINLQKVNTIASMASMTTRLNCFFDINNAKDVLNYAKNNYIPLTLCTDINKVQSDEEIIEMISSICSPVSIQNFDNFIIVQLDDYSFWVAKHLNNYNHDNLIILPDGSITDDFNDVIHCKGA